QVFHIIEALNGKSQRKQYIDFIQSTEGQNRLSKSVCLPPLLDDHRTLKQLPDGSLGRAYVEFMEKEDLTAQGLVDEYESYDKGLMEQYSAPVKWYFNRRRDTHDLLHILTGYGRDALGEASLLAFSYAVNKGLGVAFIAYGAGWELRKSAPKDAKIMRAIHEGYRLGKAADDILKYDIMNLLQRPLEDVRKDLGINPPKAYRYAHEVMRKNNLDPYDMIAPKNNAASQAPEAQAA
ncbi:MAG: Coq4 family protein, partial [Litorimonas sp.]